MAIATRIMERGSAASSFQLQTHSRVYTTLRIFFLASLLWYIRPGFAKDGGVDLSERILFVFGDSYADTGNIPWPSSNWKTPSGCSWPGQPNGRFSDGFVKTDALASQIFRVPSPPTYASVSSKPSATSGINFAVGGSGVMQAFGTPPLHQQVQWFQALVEDGVYSSDVLRNAVGFVSVSGNDYAAYNGSTLEGYFPLVDMVVNLIDNSLERLHALGLRNFMVSTLGPLNCLPARTFPTGYTSCPRNVTVEQVIEKHNALLGKKLAELQGNLDGSNFIYLLQSKALTYIQNNIAEFALNEGFRPCCAGACAQMDAQGHPLYTLCDDPGKSLFWDYFHPTQAAWNAVVALYYNDPGFTDLSSSLRVWAENL